MYDVAANHEYYVTISVFVLFYILHFVLSDDAECWTKVMSILLNKYKNDKDRISQLELKPGIYIIVIIIHIHT